LHRVAEDFGLLVTMDPKPMQVTFSSLVKGSKCSSEKEGIGGYIGGYIGYIEGYIGGYIGYIGG